MRMPWHKSKGLQLDLLDAEPEADVSDRLADVALRADAAAASPGGGPTCRLRHSHS